jgi:hypothetical protein
LLPAGDESWVLNIMGGMVGTSIDVSLGVDMIDWAIGRDPK